MTTPGENSGMSPELAKFYADRAASYDAKAARNGWTLSTHAVLSEALAELPYLPEAVLELAAGTGLSTATVLEHCNPSSLVAVEPSGAMREVLNTKFGNDNRVRLEPVSMQRYFGTARKKVDLVVGIGALHFLEKPELAAVLGGIGRCLNPGGRFMGTYNPITPSWQIARKDFGSGEIVYWYPPEEFEEMVAASGLLRIVRRKLFHPQPRGNTALESTFVEAERI